jgi:hypothetical protein
MFIYWSSFSLEFNTPVMHKTASCIEASKYSVRRLLGGSFLEYLGLLLCGGSLGACRSANFIILYNPHSLRE